MSLIDKSISNTEVIPVFDTDLFESSPESRDARFAIGVIALGNEVAPGREQEYNAYLKLRANVYADQTRMITKDHVRSDGTEIDEDDSRSIHFGIFEQNAAGMARAVSSIRLIPKNEAHPEKLPIEDFFGIEADFGTNEASRLISRHENARIQAMNKRTLFAAAISYIRNNGLGDSYATVEAPVERDFVREGMPVKRVADPIYVPEYNADNLGLIIDTDKFADILEEHTPGVLDSFALDEGKMVYYGRMPKPVGPTADIVPLRAAKTASHIPLAA